MTESSPRAIRRQDYTPPAFLVDQVDLHFTLDPAATLVRSRLAFRRNPAAAPGQPLRLDGEALELVAIALDGTPLPDTAYALQHDGGLMIATPPEAGLLEITTRIAPEKNTSLSGLYTSGGNYYTQCEAEGFRRITFFPDRPDVMARFTTEIEADAAACPVLLSNGNPDAEEILPGGRHRARWVDPHPKPSYLFALVAGDLVAVRDRFTTRSGKDVALAIWVRRGDEDRCEHAMRSLQESMRWDEEVYGLEYDLEVFNIAAVSDFNMGAMENKGLNVFNTKYVLARPDTATDTDYQGIETVIAHEYFHNWTGNRVTCRDWFQLSLKEGLTVFRDQQFSGDMGSEAVKRLRDVRALRAAQYPEDAGPMAHPVRPDSYIDIDNFYTPTVYQKGAEVVRMLHRLIGRDAFRRGMDLYFQRHDNQAVTIEDFVSAMQDASGTDLSLFARWYAQAGTPDLHVAEEWDAAAGRYTLTLRQETRPTPGQPEKLPLPIPVAMGLLGPDGAAMPARLAGENTAAAETRVLLAQRAEQRFVFEGLASRPVPSLLRGFSAPVRLHGLQPDQLRFLAQHDSDPFNRWEAIQQYATQVMLRLVADHQQGRALAFDDGLAEAAAATLAGADADPAFAAEALLLPGEAYIADQMAVVDPDAIHAVRHFLRQGIGRACAAALRSTYDRLSGTDPAALDGRSMGNRALRNACLGYLVAAAPDGIALAQAQYRDGGNMTLVLAALSLLADAEGAARDAPLADFHAKWRGDDLVLDKWFMLQAMSHRADTIAAVRALYGHADFDIKNPNRARSLVGAFAANQLRFHDAGGEGYRFLADAVMALDPMNSQTAARLVSPLGQWRRQDAARAALMQAQLRRILALPGLSKGSYEKVSKALG